MFQKGDVLFKFNIYYHIDIYEPHQKYLGFAWQTKGKINYFVFSILPFGLSSAYYAFTKLLRPLIRHWQSHGLQAVIYLDDGIVAAKGCETAMHQSMRVQRPAQRGKNDSKSQWVPTKFIVWLGFELDMDQGQLRIPEAKLQALHNQLLKTNGAKPMLARALASVIGKIVTLSPALGPVTRLMTQHVCSVEL